jgi:hypothetical protein
MKKSFKLPVLLLLLLVLIMTGCPEPTEEEFTWYYIDDPGEPSFLNGWQNWENGFDLCAYGIDSTGFVHLKGMANNPSNYNGSNQSVFVLPEGYRPAEAHLYYVFGGGADNSALVYIYSNGTVTVYDIDNAGPSATVSFDGITFFAEQ